MNLVIPVGETNELERATMIVLIHDLEKMYEGTSVAVNTFLVGDKNYGKVQLEHSKDGWKVSRDDQESIPLPFAKTIKNVQRGINPFPPESVEND